MRTSSGLTSLQKELKNDEDLLLSNYPAETEPGTAVHAAKKAFEECVNEKQAEARSKLYELLMDIETRFMVKDCDRVDEAESLYQYTRNQFCRELHRLMTKDEAKTLRYQMVTSAKVAKDSLNRLNCEWSDFADARLKNILYNFMDEDEKKKA